MRMERVFRVVGLVALVAALGTTGAEAVDMTGTWTGRERCDCFNDVAGRFTERYNDQVMQISQDGADLNVSAYDQLYNGNAIDHPTRRSKGVASLIACNTDPGNNASLGEAGRAQVSARSTGRGRMTIESIWNTAESQVCTCKARFVRTDARDPEIGECSEPDVVDAWHASMLEALPTTGLCHKVEHPSEEWVDVSCGESAAKYSQSAKSAAGSGGSERNPRLIGGPYRIGNRGYQLQAASNSYLFMVTGSFENVSGTPSIVDTHSGYPTSASGYGAGVWSLQLNSNTWDNPPKCNGRAGCKGWQQFVYSSKVPNYTDPSTGDPRGQLIIEYWLIGYGAQSYLDCPELPTPKDHYSGTYGHWNYSSGGDCWMDTGHYNVASVATAADLSDIYLTGSAGTSTDQAIIRIGNTIHALSTPNGSGGTDPFDAPDSILSLSRSWQQAEFNIFGYADLTTAVFHGDVSMDVKMTINYPRTGQFTCPIGGTTGESNSLSLEKASVGCNKIPHQTPMSFKFTQGRGTGWRHNLGNVGGH